MQAHIFGLESVILMLLIFYGLIAGDERALRRKVVFCFFLALCTTIIFVVNWYSVPLRDNQVKSMAIFDFGLPAQGFMLDDELDYDHTFEVPDQKPVSLSFRCKLFDSTGRSGYGVERAQNYFDLVYRPHGSLADFMTTELEQRGIKDELARFATSRDSTLEAVRQMVLAAGQPIGLKKVEKVKIKKQGGDS